MYPGAFPGTGGVDLGRPQVKIRGGTSEDPNQMVPPGGYNLSQMPPASAYGSQQVPSAYSSSYSQGVPSGAYSQQVPTSAYSTSTSAFSPSGGGGGGVPLGRYGVQPSSGVGQGNAPMTGSFGRTGHLPMQDTPGGYMGSPGNPQYRGSPSFSHTSNNTHTQYRGSPANMTTQQPNSRGTSQSARFNSGGAAMYSGAGYAGSPSHAAYPGSVGHSPVYRGGGSSGAGSMRFDSRPSGGGQVKQSLGSPLSPEGEGPSPSKDFAAPDSISTQSKHTGSMGNSNSSQVAPHAADAAAASMSRLSVASGGSGSNLSSSGVSEKGEGPGTQLGLPGSEEEVWVCRKFTFEQLQTATDNFSPKNFLGRGSLDAVYKGRLMGCKVAVKKLEGSGFQGPIEYRTEVEVLSRMRHPNLVLLMGHCPEEHCLVYEFLDGGSLQSCLEKKTKGAKNLLWHERVKVLHQIVDGLLYMHHHDPPIVHRDLNPANVLIDANCTVKLADVGLARLIHDDDMVTVGPKGTPGYIDPEEMMTCEVSTLGDVYAFGLIGLQLLLREGSIVRLQKLLAEVKGSAGARGFSKAADVIMSKLDASAGDWPLDVTRQLAVLFLRCTEAQRMRRPDLAEEIQPVLHRANEKAAAEAQRQSEGLHSQLMCPLSKVRMTDPVLAADGFTYEKSAIEVWLQKSQDSPVTGQPLEHTFLMPNNGLKQILLSS